VTNPITCCTRHNLSASSKYTHTHIHIHRGQYRTCSRVCIYCIFRKRSRFLQHSLDNITDDSYTCSTFKKYISYKLPLALPTSESHKSNKIRFFISAAVVICGMPCFIPLRGQKHTDILRSHWKEICLCCNQSQCTVTTAHCLPTYQSRHLLKHSLHTKLVNLTCSDQKQQ